MPECPPGVHSMFDPCPGNCTEPVDEEAELFENLWSMEYRITGDKPRAKEFARRFLDEHAHVLAEKIRNSKRLRDYTDDHMSDCYEAADEIDPGVTTSGDVFATPTRAQAAQMTAAMHDPDAPLRRLS